jgi:hypothetical protein
LQIVWTWSRAVITLVFKVFSYTTMIRRSARDNIEIVMMLLPIVFGIFVLISNAKRPRTGTTFYFASKEAVRARIAPRRVGRFVSPFDLVLQRVNDRSTNVIGWLTVTNSGVVNTQWFRCRIESGQVAGLQIFQQNPTLRE